MVNLPQTPQETAKRCLEQPIAAHLSKKDQRFLFSVESWPADLPIKLSDLTRLQKLYARIMGTIGS